MEKLKSPIDQHNISAIKAGHGDLGQNATKLDKNARILANSLIINNKAQMYVQCK